MIPKYLSAMWTAMAPATGQSLVAVDAIRDRGRIIDTGFAKEPRAQFVIGCGWRRR